MKTASFADSSRRSPRASSLRFPRPLGRVAAPAADAEVEARAWIVVLSFVLFGFLGLVTWELCRTGALVIPASAQETGYAPACESPALRPFYGIGA